MAVVGSIIEALFPPLPDQAEECRRAGDQLSAAFYEWRGMKDPELLLKVASQFCLASLYWLRWTAVQDGSGP